MANAKINFTLTSAPEIAVLSDQADKLSSNASSLSNDKQISIITAYTYILTDLATSGVKLVKRGQKEKALPVAVTSALREQLSEAGVSAPNTKRFVENILGLLPVMPELLDAKDFGSVALTLHNAGIDTQSKLKNKFKPVADPIEVLAKKFAQLDGQERIRFLEIVEGLDNAAALAAKAVEDANDSSEVINETLAELESA